MKTVFLFSLALAAQILVTSGLVAAPARVQVFVLGDSLEPIARSNVISRFEAFACAETTPSGTTMVLAGFNEGTCHSLIEPLVVPKLKYDSKRARQIAFATSFASARAGVIKAPSAAGGIEGITLQGVFHFLRTMHFTNRVSLLVAGSPIVKCARPQIDLESFYPSDGTILAGEDVTPLGLGSFSGFFSQSRMSWWWPGTHSLPLPSERKLTRYLSVAGAHAGVSLVACDGDLATALTGFGDLDRDPAQVFPMRSEPSGLWPYRVEEISKLGIPHKLASALDQLRARGVSRALAASWQTPSDVDLLVNCSSQFPGEVCSWRSPSTPHLRLLGDLRHATAQGYEIITLDESVVLDSGLDVKLNLYSSEAPAAGFLVLMMGEQLFRLPFQFPVESRGNRGGDPRLDSPHWLTIDMKRLVASPIVPD